MRTTLAHLITLISIASLAVCNALSGGRHNTPRDDADARRTLAADLTPGSANVVFVHGFLGWGPGEFANINYWGGFGDVLHGTVDYKAEVAEPHFNYRGDWIRHKTYEAVVGPVASNHDRACELYAQILGRVVDYGAVHAAKYQHNRFGRNFTGRGFIPNWSSANPISLIGHSMGTTTIRALEKYLQLGAEEEVAGTPPDGPPVSDLFLGNKKNWVISYHFISALHSGSTLVPRLGPSMMSTLKSLVLDLGTLTESNTATDSFYDFKMDQFNLTRFPGESFTDYVSRVMDSPILNGTFKDVSSYDLGPTYAYEFANTTKHSFPGTYYFSHATAETQPRYTGAVFQESKIEMEFFLKPFAYEIGEISDASDADARVRRCPPDTGGFCYNSSWNENDGLVPLVGGDMPRLGYSNPSEPLPRSAAVQCASNGCCCSYTWPDSRWISTKHSRDHVQVIGFTTNTKMDGDQSDGIYYAIRTEIDYVWSRPSLASPTNYAAAQMNITSTSLGSSASPTCGIPGMDFTSCCFKSFTMWQTGDAVTLFPPLAVCAGRVCPSFKGTVTKRGVVTTNPYVNGTLFSPTTVIFTKPTLGGLLGWVYLTVTGSSCKLSYDTVSGSSNGGSVALFTTSELGTTEYEDASSSSSSPSGDTAIVVGGVLGGVVAAVATLAIVRYRRALSNATTARDVARRSVVVVVSGVTSANPGFDGEGQEVQA